MLNPRETVAAKETCMYQGMRNGTLRVFPGDQTNSTSLIKQAKPQQTETVEVCHKSNNQPEKLDGPFTS